MRVRCPERWGRPWDVFTTPVGGRLRSLDLVGQLPDGARRALSQAWVATNVAPPVSVGADLQYWASVCRKILQRGELPAVSPDVDAALLALYPPEGDLGAGDLLAAAVGRLDTSTELDESYQLHPTWEVPFWQAVGQRAPGLHRWLVPQPSLEALAGVVRPPSGGVTSSCARRGRRRP